MLHNLKSELTESMDSLHYTDFHKERIYHNLTQKKPQARKTYSLRRVWAVAAAAVMLLGLLTGAAAFTRWSDTAQARYNPSEEVKEQAAESGLSVMLEDTAGEVLSATDQGITITAVQTLVDQYRAEIIFRVEGFAVPEGRFPDLWPTITLDGSDNFYSMQSNDFRTDGDAFEYIQYITFDEDASKYFGKELVAVFDSVALQSEVPAGAAQDAITGHWELRWTFTGTEDVIHLAPMETIGSSGVVLLEADIGQKSIRTLYQLESYWAGWETLETFQPQLTGVRLKDGTECSCYASTEGYQDLEGLVYFVESSMDSNLLDLSQVDALVYGVNDSTYYVPIS